MKLIKALSLLLALTLTLTACNESGTSSEAEQSSQITQSTPQSTSSTTQTSSVPEEVSVPERVFPVVIYPNMTVKPDEELAEALKPLEEFGRFYATYLFMDMYQNYLFGEKPEWFTEEKTGANDRIYDQQFTKVEKCGITTYSAMMEKLDSMLTEKCIEDTAREIKNRFRAGENGELFVENTGAGGYLGDSYLRLNKITYPDDKTILLDMAVIGEAEEWGYEQDLVEDFSITLKRTAGGLKIDGFDGAINKTELFAGHYDFYPLTHTFLQYNNIFLELDNRTEFSENYALEHADDANKYYRPLNETEEIIKLLEDNAKPGKTPAEGSALYLDSVEYPDENTIRISVTARYAQGSEEKATAEFTRTDDGLQLKAYDPAILELFAHYSEIQIERQ